MKINYILTNCETDENFQGQKSTILTNEGPEEHNSHCNHINKTLKFPSGSFFKYTQKVQKNTYDREYNQIEINRSLEAVKNRRIVIIGRVNY